MRSSIRLITYLKPYRLWAFFSLLSLCLAVVADLSIPRLTQAVIDLGINAGDGNAIIRYSLFMLAFALGGAVFQIVNTLMAVRVSQYAAADIRSAVIQRIQSLSFGNLDRLQSGQLLVRATGDVVQVQSMIMMSLRMLLRAPMWMTGSMLMLWRNTPDLLPLLGVLMLVVLAFIILAVVKVRALFRIVQDKLDALNQVLIENLSGIRVVKAFVREDHEKTRFEAANASLTDTNVHVMQTLAYLFPTMTLFISLGVAGALWQGGTGVTQGIFTMGEIVAAFNYLMLSLFPLMMLGGMIGPLASAEASAARILEVLDSEPDVKEPVPDSVTRNALAGSTGEIIFDRVCFRYPASQDDVLHNISLSIEPGKTLAILGSTGSGKSSLVNLVPRYYDVTSGCISIDGVDIRKMPVNELRSRISMVMQETILFSGTILDNILFGRPEASFEEVKAAAVAACADDFISDFPEGYHSIIGRRGINLSGGQKQRIAIARSLLAEPDILILDDSTSAVDVETEANIERAIRDIREKRAKAGVHPLAVVIVAQRISTVINADRIIVLESGSIAASGKHESLLKNSRIYGEIYDSQLGGME